MIKLVIIKNMFSMQKLMIISKMRSKCMNLKELKIRVTLKKRKKLMKMVEQQEDPLI